MFWLVQEMNVLQGNCILKCIVASCVLVMCIILFIMPVNKECKECGVIFQDKMVFLH